jgi:hypothetical protein
MTLVLDADMVLPARRLAVDGLEAWAQVLERGYEGMVAKDEVSPYRKTFVIRELVAEALADPATREAAIQEFGALSRAQGR